MQYFVYKSAPLDPSLKPVCIVTTRFLLTHLSLYYLRLGLPNWLFTSRFQNKILHEFVSP